MLIDVLSGKICFHISVLGSTEHTTTDLANMSGCCLLSFTKSTEPVKMCRIPFLSLLCFSA